MPDEADDLAVVAAPSLRLKRSRRHLIVAVVVAVVVTIVATTTTGRRRRRPSPRHSPRVPRRRSPPPRRPPGCRFPRDAPLRRQPTATLSSGDPPEDETRVSIHIIVIDTRIGTPASSVPDLPRPRPSRIDPRRRRRQQQRCRLARAAFSRALTASNPPPVRPSAPWMPIRFARRVVPPRLRLRPWT